MHVVASVPARLGTTRLPGAVLLHLGGRRILRWVLDRTDDAETVDRTVVAVGDRPANEAIVEFCNREDVPTVVGPEENPLARHVAVAERTDADLLVRVTADSPFVPSREIDRVVREHRSNRARYTTNATDAMPAGTAVDALDPDLLEELEARGETDPVARPCAEPEAWGTTWSDNFGWGVLSQVDMAADTPADYWSLVDAVDAAGESPRAVAEWLAR